MAVIRPNVLIALSRPDFNAATGVTRAANLSEPDVPAIEAYVNSTSAQEYMKLPASITANLALGVAFTFTVDADLDIASDDQLTAVVLIDDGETPYPGDTADDALGIAWIVRYVAPPIAGLLDSKKVTVERKQTRGPLHR